MRRLRWLSFFCLWPAAAMAGENTSAYTSFDLEKTCRKVEQGDEYVFAGSWECPGYKGAKLQISVSDDRSFVGFGPSPGSTCAFRKTFSRFNTPLSPVEWRLRKGKAFATIQRWRVTTDDDGGSVTWLVITKLDGKEACHVHYIAGSYPDANAHARRVADDLANEDFDCATDGPTIDSKIGEPGIDLSACRDLPAE
ncbi:hypothetical protein [Aestuariivirga sp.]|uniref:hypothetical protein n=1 Tax=Aestuariivirga sp. TaxID=2650926 RepID=UPI003BAD6169